MKKILSILISILISVSIFTGCTENSVSNNNSNIGTLQIGGYTCYKINLRGQSVDTYFTVNDPGCGIGVTMYSLQNAADDIMFIHYSAISEGGYIAYYDDLVIYLPQEAGIEAAKVACSILAVSSDPSSFLSVGQARKYLPWL